MAENTVSFRDFQKLDLRVGEIRAVEDIEGLDKIYKMVVDLGEEQRTILAGIKQWYKKEDLIGKQVVVVVNLEPKTIAGIESQGMILAADYGGHPILLTTIEQADPGSKVR